MSVIRCLLRDEKGTSGLEYAVLAAVILAGVATGAAALGEQVMEGFAQVGAMWTAEQGGPPPWAGEPGRPDHAVGPD